MSSELKHLLISSTKEIKQIVINYMKDKPELLDDLIEMSFSNSQPESWRSAWVLAELAKKDKNIRIHLQPLSTKIIQSFKIFNSPGQIREYLKIIQLLDVRKEDIGLLIDMCFNWLLDRKADQSFRVYAMQIIYDYSKNEPDLLPELKAILEQELEYAKPGFKNRAIKILKKIG